MARLYSSRCGASSGSGGGLASAAVALYPLRFAVGPPLSAGATSLSSGISRPVVLERRLFMSRLIPSSHLVRVGLRGECWVRGRVRIRVRRGRV